MDLSTIRRRLIFSRDWVQLALLIFISYGFITKFFISINQGLDSDSVGMGLMSMEIGKYHNFLLSGYHLLSSDSLVLTELLPFQLIPQILTSYNPIALKLVVFILFILSIFILACIAYLITKNFMAALIFGALAANIPPEGYFWFAYPTTHNATIFFGALILLIFLVMTFKYSIQTKIEGKSQKTIKNDKGFPWPYSITLIVLVFSSVFSDTLILIWVIFPVIIAYVLMYERKTHVMNAVLIAITFASVSAYVIKTYFIPGWIETNYGISSVSDIFLLKIPLFLKAQAIYLNAGLYKFMKGSGTLDPLDILSILLFIVLIAYSLRNIAKDMRKITSEKRLFYAILFLSIAMIVLSFLISTYAYDMGGARYLTFGALVIFMLVGISYPEREKIFIFIVLSLLVLSGISSLYYIGSMDPDPNEREYDLISYLAQQNLTYGYGTYWDSNIITYLSNEKVTIRSTFFLTDTIQPHLLNSCDRWWEYQPESTFLINDTARRSDKSQSGLALLVKNANISTVLHYRDYDIYPVRLTFKSVTG